MLAKHAWYWLAVVHNHRDGASEWELQVLSISSVVYGLLCPTELHHWETESGLSSLYCWRVIYHYQPADVSLNSYFSHLVVGILAQETLIVRKRAPLSTTLDHYSLGPPVSTTLGTTDRWLNRFAGTAAVMELCFSNCSICGASDSWLGLLWIYGKIW